MGQSRTTSSRVEAAERRRRALELRKAGADYRNIARLVGFSGPGAAWKAVDRALADTVREHADDVRRLELERLDRLQAAVWGRAVGGDLEAVDRVLRMMERRAKYLGLDAPTRFRHSVEDLLDTEIRRLEAENADLEAATFDQPAITAANGNGAVVGLDASDGLDA